jgi:hypothetical protein
MTEESLENKRSLSVIAGGLFNMDWTADNNKFHALTNKHRTYGTIREEFGA